MLFLFFKAQSVDSKQMQLNSYQSEETMPLINRDQSVGSNYVNMRNLSNGTLGKADIYPYG